jgi:hypothetical protein
MKTIQKKDLSDLDVETLGNGFTVVVDDGKPVAAIAKFGYYRYISWLIEQVKDYVQKTKQVQPNDTGNNKDR